MNIENIKIFILSLVLKLFTRILNGSELAFNNNTIVTIRSYSSIHKFIIRAIDIFFHVTAPFDKHIMAIRGLINNLVNYSVINTMMYILLPWFLEPKQMLGEEEFNAFVNKNFTYKPANKRSPPLNLGTAEGLTWLFTHSFGFLFLDKVGTEYICDFTYLKKYELKEGFPVLACKVVFGMNNNKLYLKYIEYEEKKYHVGDINFDSVSRIVGSACMSVVGVYHGLYTHIIIADTVELLNVMILSKDHPLRRLMAFAEYNVYIIGSSVYFVAYSKMIGTVKHIHSFTDKGWNALTSDFYADFDVETWGHIPKMLATKNYDLDDLSWSPIAQDSLTWWNSIRKFVESYVNCYYTSDLDVSSDTQLITWIKTITERIPSAKINNVDDLIDFITVIIYDGAIHHEVVGEDIKFLLFDPYQLSITVKQNPITNKIEPYSVLNALRTLILYHMVSLNINRIYKDWSYLALEENTAKNNIARHIFKEFYDDMGEIKKEIQHRNKSRDIPLEILYPENIATSAGI